MMYFQLQKVDFYTPGKTKDMNGKLVGGWTNPSETYARQIGSFPQVRVKIKHVWNHYLEKHGKTQQFEDVSPIQNGQNGAFSLSSWFSGG